MNERIRQLAEQANAFARENVEYSRTEGFEIFTDKLYEVSREKFAELLLKECAGLVAGVPTDTMGYHTADQKIKQHFGVEE
jgi:hypothetical protein